MRKRLWMWIALSAMGPWVIDCGSTADLSCKSDKDCLESEICHPDELMCVPLCTTSANCPTKTPTCQAISDSNRTKICKCTTGACDT